MGGMARPAVINYVYGFLQGANCLAAYEMKVNVSAKYTYVNSLSESQIKLKLYWMV